jgi:RNA polymerase sigma-70 factor, ECF subfamily
LAFSGRGKWFFEEVGTKHVAVSVTSQALATAVPDTAPSIAALYREHYDFVWRNVRRLGAEDEWADDAVQEVFLVAARRLAEFEQRANPKTWLFAIALRVVQRLQRNRQRYQKRVTRYAAAHSVSAVNDPWDRDYAARLLRRLLEQLSEEKRIVLILAELEGFTSAEIARAVGAKQGTVDSRLRQARLDLTRLLTQLQRKEQP